MVQWTGMGKERISEGIAEMLEEIATTTSQHYIALYIASVCRGVALGLRDKLKEGLVELDRAIRLEPKSWDAYFWKGMLCAYYYQGRHQVVVELIEKSLELDLPPALLTPLYWLKNDRSNLFMKHLKSLLAQYDM
jgi:tetratricopeptide (TPR) repeat protein